jgi:hypothetical protein
MSTTRTSPGARSFTIPAALGLLLLGPTAHAQVLIGYLFGERLASPGFNMGFEVGVNFSTLDGPEGAKRGRRSVFGLFYDWRFCEHVHLGGAVLPIAGRSISGLTPPPTGDPAFDAETKGALATRNLSYIEFPVLLKWAPKRETGLRVGAGPSFGLITGASDRYDVATPTGAPYVVERDIGSLLPTLDFGVSMDIEWRLGALSIAARYTHGLTDLRLPGDQGPVRSRVLTGTGRIALGGKKKASSP